MRSAREQVRRIPKAIRRAVVVALAAFPWLRAPAQETPAVIVGTVTDSATNVGIAGAEVLVAGSPAPAITNERGEFRITAAPGPRATLRVRRLGFGPRVVAWEARPDGEPTQVALAPLVQHLAPVLVRAEKTRYTGRLAGYYERLERRSVGQFITRADMERESQTQLSQVLRRAPGVTFARGRSGVISSVRMRGRECWPLVWLDGAQMGAGDIDIDSFSPSSLEGIELYLGSASAPSRYQAARGKSECGTILLWSRGSDTEARQSRGGVTAADLEAMIASVSVYTAQQVDSPAVLDTVRSPPVLYPQSMRASGTNGLVVAEFIVDSAGRVEPDNIGVMSATDPLFADAVRDALSRATFYPARLKGRSVRQIMRLPFSFQAPGGGGARQ